MARYTNGKPRRITKIRVDEISEVDRPANGIPFLFYKREDGKPSSEPAPATNPELAEWASPDARRREASADYDGSTVAGILASIGKASPGTTIDPEDVPPGLSPADYARARERIDADGVVAVNSPRLYPPVHVPSAVDTTHPISV